MPTASTKSSGGGTFGSAGRFSRGNVSSKAPATSIHHQSPSARAKQKMNHSNNNQSTTSGNFIDPTKTPPPSSGPPVLSPLEQNNNNNNGQPYGLDELLAISPETPNYNTTTMTSNNPTTNNSVVLTSSSANFNSQQQQQQQRPSSASLSARGKPPQTSSRPMSATSQTSSTRVDVSSGSYHQKLSSQNLEKMTGHPAPGIPGTSSRSRNASARGTTKASAIQAFHQIRSRAKRQIQGGVGGGAASLVMNEDLSIEDEERSWPLLNALHVAKDQLHLPSRVIEWMRETLSWNLSSNATEANDELIHVVDTVRGMTLELFKMVDEIESLHEKAMGSWRSIPMGGDSMMTAKSHASFVDAHGRLKQVVEVFQRLVQHWQMGHTKLFDLARPASVPAQAPSSFIFTCGISDGDDYVQLLNDKLAMLQSTAESFSSMIFEGSPSAVDQNSKEDAMKPPSIVQKKAAVSFQDDDHNKSKKSNNSFSSATMGDGENDISQQQQTAEDFSIVRRPMSAAKRRLMMMMPENNINNNDKTKTYQDESLLKSPLVPAALRRQIPDASSNSQQNFSSVSFQSANSIHHQSQQQNSSSTNIISSSRAAFEARKIRSISLIQKWWRKIFKRLQHGIAKKGDDLLFDEAMQMMSASHQQRWTKRDTMLLHDIARRLHFLRCIRRIERFIIFMWIPKHFSVLKMQRAVRAFFWRKRDKLYRMYRGATIKIQRWYWECLRRSDRRHMLKNQREQAIKARTLRAAASAPTAIRPPPPPEFDENIITRDDCTLKTDRLLNNFVTFQRGSNLCYDWFEKNGGVEGNKWSDEEEDEDDQKNQKNNQHQDRDEDDDDENDEEAMKRNRRGGGRPRSAAERFLVRPGRKTSSFTQRMLRFADPSSTMKK